MFFFVYDFDKTIYQGDSTIDFCLFCAKRHWKIYGNVLKAIMLIPCTKLRLTTLEYVKGILFAFLKYIDKDELDYLLEAFWNSHNYKMQKWYITQQQFNDIIITASPEFLVKACPYLISVKVIGTQINIENGRLLSNNCKGQEKVKRLKQLPPIPIEEFYSDSKSDLPLARLARHAFLVNRKEIVKWIIK